MTKHVHGDLEENSDTQERQTVENTYILTGMMLPLPGLFFKAICRRTKASSSNRSAFLAEAERIERSEKENA